MFDCFSDEVIMTAWEFTQKYYPAMAARNYVFTTNMPKENIDNHKEVKECKDF